MVLFIAIIVSFIIVSLFLLSVTVNAPHGGEFIYTFIVFDRSYNSIYLYLLSFFFY